MPSQKNSIDSFFPAIGIDTSFSPGDTALAISTDEITRENGPSLLPTLSSLLEKAGLSPKDIRFIVIGTGPGSFTGLRAGMSAAMVLAEFLPAPVVGLTSLRGSPILEKPGFKALCLDALRGDVQGTFFKEGGEEVEAPMLVKPETFSTLMERHSSSFDHYGARPIIAGSGIPILDEKGLIPREWDIVVDKNEWLPRADCLLKQGLIEAYKGKFSRLEELEPLYLRLSAAEEKRREKGPD